MGNTPQRQAAWKEANAHRHAQDPVMEAELVAP
jgi:hypothetical protein